MIRKITPDDLIREGWAFTFTRCCDR